MSDLLIPNLDPDTQRSLERSARAHDRDIADEAKALLRSALGVANTPPDIAGGPPPGVGVGTWMRGLVPEEYRGDDIVFEMRGPGRPPPDFD